MTRFLKTYSFPVLLLIGSLCFCAYKFLDWPWEPEQAWDAVTSRAMHIRDTEFPDATLVAISTNKSELLPETTDMDFQISFEFIEASGYSPELRFRSLYRSRFSTRDRGSHGAPENMSYLRAMEGTSYISIIDAIARTREQASILAAAEGTEVVDVGGYLFIEDFSKDGHTAPAYWIITYTNNVAPPQHLSLAFYVHAQTGEILLQSINKL